MPENGGADFLVTQALILEVYTILVYIMQKKIN